MATITVKQVAYHRNGISGEGFHVVTFREHDLDLDMIATVFDPDGYDEAKGYAALGFHNPRIAILALDALPDVTFGENSWRGDEYATALYEAIEEFGRERDVALGL